MKQLFAYATGLMLLISVACKKEAGRSDQRTVHARTTMLPANSTLPPVVAAGDTLFLTRCNSYILDGKCYIDSLATIVIEPGVVIRAIKKQSAIDASALVVCRGAKIFAYGNETSPITFTSNEASPAPEDWGGVVIMGRAPVNKVNFPIEGIAPFTVPAGLSINYGGNVPNDNSGILAYVKILYAGIAIAADNELNGLTLGGVGSGTRIDHIYMGYGGDDAFEMFGGTVSLKYIIAQSPRDDCFDFDFGYTGSIQFALAFVKSTDNTFNGTGGSNGIESDNDLMGSFDVPRTRPVISNMTIIGTLRDTIPGTLYANRWRRNTSLIVRNSVLMGYNRALQFEGGAMPDNFQYNLVHAFSSVSNVTLPANNTLYINPLNSNTGILLKNPFGTWCSTGPALLVFDPRPLLPASPAASGANYTGLPDNSNFFTFVPYRGAFSPAAVTASDWTAFACDNTPCD